MRKDKTNFIKGMDVSSLLELERLGVVFRDEEGQERELLSILQEYGVNAIRLRMWNDPYSRMNEPYGGGTNDLDTTITLARRAKARGMKVLLNIHYSDFWADMGKQIKPKLWADFRGPRLEQAVYDYTRAVLQRCKDRGAFPDMVQVGNDLSNGLLWPDGKVPDYDNIAMLISAGIRAVKTVDSMVPVMLHLDGGTNNMQCRIWLDSYMDNQGEDFEVIGLSYFPFRHGPMAGLENNMKDMAKRYGKEVIVAEVAMGYTMEDYAECEGLNPKERKGTIVKPEQAKKLEYPMTKEGQAAFMKAFLNKLVKVPEGLGGGFFYWEPAWLPVPGSSWATEASLKYLESPGPGGNEWANQALFDYEGRPLPALRVIRDFDNSAK